LLARYGAAIVSAISPATSTYTEGTPKTAGSSERRERTLIVFAGTGVVRARRKMPEKPLTIATYAAGASLAAITLVYVFGPTFFLDDEAAQSSKSTRKKGVVGLVNPANDCFINSVLQALAGLPDLRAFLIREVHRRKLDGPQVYSDLSAALEEESKKKPGAKRTPEWQIEGLQQGLVTAGLKDVLDALNERPIYKKTISAQSFIRCVEQAFRTRISRTQQDAQEFLQVIVERVAEEYNAGKRVRRKARKGLAEGFDGMTIEPPRDSIQERANASLGDQPRDSKILSTANEPGDEDPEQNENVFPLQGKLESQVECSHCHFKPKPTASSFFTLTLHVPHLQTSATLNECFDGLLKVEHIDDFVCDRCRLEHAMSVNSRRLAKSNLAASERRDIEEDQAKLQKALDKDPEKPPKDVKLPDSSTAPKRRIARHTRISSFPKILSVHLSRSVWDPSASSAKNQAKVSFPESLPLGGLLDRKSYRLLGVVTHKGGHNSGHYESFRRQVLPQPFSTPNSMGTEGVFSMRNSPVPSVVNSPRLSARSGKEERHVRDSPVSSTDSQSLSTPTSGTASSSSRSSTQPLEAPIPSAEKRRSMLSTMSVPSASQELTPTAEIPAPPISEEEATDTPAPIAHGVPAAECDAERPKRTSSIRNLRGITGSQRRKKTSTDRWWRISDEKIKESKTSDVLGMQREVYMLFYEMVEA
ncbi:hypothetical protein AC579_9837, partial [Pseudocercospora musae]